MTTSKSISIPAVIYAMLQELSDKNRKKPEYLISELVKNEYYKKRWRRIFRHESAMAALMDLSKLFNN